YHRGRVGVEGDDHRLQSEVARPLHGRPDDLLVAAVYPVEDPDRHHRTAPTAGHGLVIPPSLHCRPPRSESPAPESPRPSARPPPSPPIKEKSIPICRAST